jgi:hypothetical protein
MGWEIALIIWTVCAVTAWAIAHVKGAPDEVTWGVLGLLFGPFGVLAAIVVAKPGPPAEAAPVAAVPLGDACPKCGKRRVSAYQRCQGCAADLGVV